MLRRPRALRRPAALLTSLVVVAGLGAACGEETTIVSGAQPRAEAVEVDGEVGSSPEVTWESRLEAGDAETEVLVEGDGAELEEGDRVVVDYYVGNGFTQRPALDTYTDELVPTVFPVGGEVPQPQSAEPSPEAVARYLLDVVVAEQVEAGDTVGTRKVTTVSSEDVLGVAGAALGIGNEDALLLVIDISGVVRTGPDGDPVRERPAWVPGIVFEDGAPSALRFDGVPAPDGTLKTAVLYQGEGPAVEENDLLVVDYLGSVYDTAEPFDASYGRDTLTIPLGQDAVIRGWEEALVGVEVGSRVMLQIPPRLGYGADGSGEDIPGDATLYFVIDVLAAG